VKHPAGFAGQPRGAALVESAFSPRAKHFAPRYTTPDECAQIGYCSALREKLPNHAIQSTLPKRE
jgi:hypothetical protein